MLTIRNLNKVFASYPRRLDRIKEWLCFGSRIFHEEIHVLKDINLEIKAGEAFGLVGMNGAGKSTLLKLITKTMLPTSGSIESNGKIAALLELGTGFHPDLTGRENILLNGRLHGLEPQEITAKIDTIKAFSELGDYFDKPLKKYSTGMYVRLGFSLAISVNPQVLIVDEALSVGDAYFQQKCLRKIRDFKEAGVTILFVSHDLACVKILCDRVGLLNKGSLVAVGEPKGVLDRYNALISGHDVRQTTKGELKVLVSGSGKAEIAAVSLLNEEGQKVQALEAGQFCQIAIDVLFNAPVSNPTVGILIRDRLGYDVFGTNSSHMQHQTGDFLPNSIGHFSFRFAMDIGPGEYTLSLAIHADASHLAENYQWADSILLFKVHPNKDYPFLGVSMLKPTFEIGPHEVKI